MILRIAAFLTAAVDLIVKAVEDIKRKSYFSYPILILVIGAVSLAIDQYIESVLIILIYTICLKCFEYIYHKSVNDVYSSLENIQKNLSGMYLENEKVSRIKNVSAELKSSGLSPLRKTGYVYSKFSLGILLLGLLVSIVVPLIDDMQFKKWIYRGLIIASIAFFFRSHLCFYA